MSVTVTIVVFHCLSRHFLFSFSICFQFSLCKYVSVLTSLFVCVVLCLPCFSFSFTFFILFFFLSFLSSPFVYLLLSTLLPFLLSCFLTFSHFFVIIVIVISSPVLFVHVSYFVTFHILFTSSFAFHHHYLSIAHHCFPSFHVCLCLCISLSFSFSFTIFLPTEQEDESSALRVDNDKVRADLHLTKLRLLAELDACHVQSATYFPLFSSIAGSSILNTCTLCWKIYQEYSTGGVWDSNGFAH